MGKLPESGDPKALPDGVAAVADCIAEVPVQAAVVKTGFPRSARLLNPGTFTAVFEKRSARRGRFFHLHFGAMKETEADGATVQLPRLGVAVPKKLLKTAVHRNLVKRIARETFRCKRQTLLARDYVLRLSVKLDPKKQALDRSALAADIAALLDAQRLPRPASTEPSPTEARCGKTSGAAAK